MLLDALTGRSHREPSTRLAADTRSWRRIMRGAPAFTGMAHAARPAVPLGRL
ncbi:hypothetical protein G6O69_14475 [Pseudenhygromyxa sp. WMMC2535]|uniref:hypothetical protein n=1 Tax=Pseudenhygromyxa sp. WMMC2535 TaxID=2712867 RepID=UPI00159627E2|nr:hypothetical protein [Pseudenhygromyxa sp. WMMC2535]NVB39045.1 hypothetical protein [Pseudenhygromyxa sp. WMMC2535]